MLQGVSTGGEYVGTMIFVSEHAPDKKRGMLASFLPLSSQGGFVVAGTLVTVLQAAPLLLSAPLGLVAPVMRLRLGESPADQEANHDGEIPSDGDGQQLNRTILEQHKPLLVGIGLVLAYNITDYMLAGYLPTYMKAVVRIGHAAGMAMIVLTLLAVMAALVFVARLSDRIGVKPIVSVGCGLLVALAIPALLLLSSGGSYPVVFLGVLLIGTMLLCFDSTRPATLPALFPTRVRYGALAVGFNISVSTSGGGTALVAEALISSTKQSIAPAYMPVLAVAPSPISRLCVSTINNVATPPSTMPMPIVASPSHNVLPVTAVKPTPVNARPRPTNAALSTSKIVGSSGCATDARTATSYPPPWTEANGCARSAGCSLRTAPTPPGWPGQSVARTAAPGG